jgi:hypothetical protein
VPYSIVQSNTGTTITTSGTATLSSGTAAGNTLVLVLGHGGNPSTVTVTGFTLGTGTLATTSAIHRMYYKTAVAAETSWGFTLTAASPTTWWIAEVAGLDNGGLIDAKPTNVNSGTTAAADTFGASGTNPQSTTYDGLVLAVHNSYNSAAATIPTWSGQGQGLVEEVDFGVVSGATAVGTAISTRSTDIPTTWDIAATSSVATFWTASHYVLNCLGARHQPDIVAMAGFEQGTVAGIATGSTGGPAFDVLTGSPSVTTTSPRSGSYALRCTAAAGTCNLAWSSNSLSVYPPATASLIVLRVCFRFPTSLPSGDVEVFSALGPSLTGPVLWYRTATQKLGMKNVTGTEIASNTTVAADKWIAVDLRFTATTTAYTADWQVDYDSLDTTAGPVVQTQATGTGASAGTVGAIRIGWNTSATATIDYDDIVLTKNTGHYPLGDHRIYPLTVDPAGTVTLSGTTTNFSTFTSNGTLAAWNATTARNNVDEIPPTIGASADGFVQTATAASDYVEVPMTTRDCASNGESIKGVRWYFPGWATSATANAIGFRGWDGTTETTLWAAADPGFDNSTTTPGWVCRMQRSTSAVAPYAWTQGKLDALAARIGFSSDATVDVGVHAVIAELAVRADPTVLQVASAEIGGEAFPGEVATITAKLDADSGLPLYYTATAPASTAAVATYIINGSTVTDNVPVGTSVSRTVTVDDVSGLSFVGITGA